MPAPGAYNVDSILSTAPATRMLYSITRHHGLDQKVSILDFRTGWIAHAGHEQGALGKGTSNDACIIMREGVGVAKAAGVYPGGEARLFSWKCAEETNSTRIVALTNFTNPASPITIHPNFEFPHPDASFCVATTSVVVVVFDTHNHNQNHGC